MPEVITPEITLTPFQERLAATPETVDLALLGGRGGGKSWGLCILIVRHVFQHGTQAKCLFIRRTYGGLRDFEALTMEMFPVLIPGARYNQTEHLWRFPSGATLELGFLAAEPDFARYQGRSFSLVIIDEAGQFPEPRLVDRLRSSLRAPDGVPCRMIIAANPGGPGHSWLARRYVQNGTQPWHPFSDERGRTWIRASSTIADNPNLDQAAYVRQLEDACAGDPELLAAWTDGRWDIARGAYFGGVLDEAKVATDAWTCLPGRVDDGLKEWQRRNIAGNRLSVGDRAPSTWRYFLSHDFGVSAPAVTYLVGKSPGAEGPDGRWYPRGSFVLIDEHTTADPAHPERGRGLTVPDLAAEIKLFAGRWGVPASGFADDSIFSRSGSSEGSIAEEFSRYGVHWRRATKGGRVAGWQRMRSLLAAAGEPDRAGMYVSRLCRLWWETVPVLPRDPRNPDDVDSKANDHAADAARYACTGQETGVGVIDLVWRR